MLLLHSLLFFAALGVGEAHPSSPDALHSPDARALAPLIAWPPFPASGSSLHLIENHGQWPSEVLFAAKLPGLVVRAERDALGLELRPEGTQGAGTLIRLAFEDANAASVVEGLGLKEAIHSYFFGSDPGRWIRAAPSFTRLRYVGLYPGIDLELGGANGRLKYDLFVAAGADAHLVRIRVEGETALDAGDGALLTLDSVSGRLLHLPGRSWEVLPDGSRRDVECLWHVVADGLLELRVPDRDPTLPLVVDPELAWATYYGSSDFDEMHVSTVDARGDLYVGGGTLGSDFPTTPGAFNAGKPGFDIMNVSKFRGAVGELVFSALYGGSTPNQSLASLVLDSQTRPTLTGSTEAPDFPTTPGSYDPVKSTLPIVPSAYVLRLTAGGADLHFSTFIEGPMTGSEAWWLEVDARDRAIVTGFAKGPDYPTTPRAFQTVLKGLTDSFVSCLSDAGDALEWSTLLGGNSNVDAIYRSRLSKNGEILLAGATASKDFPTTPGAYKQSMTSLTWTNAFITRMSPEGEQLRWSTLLGGNGQQEWDLIVGLALDAAENVYVLGNTNSSSFPVTPGAYRTSFPQGATTQDFLTRLDPRGSSLLSSTFLGNEKIGFATGMDLDPSGIATVTGFAYSGPRMTPGAYSTVSSGNLEGIVVRLTPAGDSLIYGSYLGGPSNDHAQWASVSPPVRAFVTGSTWFPPDFPVTPGAFQGTYAGGQADGFVAALDLWLRGVESEGEGAPACLGPLVANVSEMPTSQASLFTILCSAAPPAASGWLLLADAISATAVQQGDPILLDPTTIHARIPVKAGEAGFVEVVHSLAGFPAGHEFAAQFVFEGTESCGGLGSKSTSNALRIRLQH